MKTTTTWARALTARFRRQRILVVGDMMLDRYICGTATRISPEAPVPVVRVAEERHVPGGAANVARNVQALGGHAVLSGLVGRDAAGTDLMAVLRRFGVTLSGVTASANARTTVKTRVLAERQQIVRVDWEARPCLSPAQRRAFCRKAAAAARGATGVVFADYDKGVIQQDVVDAVMDAARVQGIPTALDPKHNPDLRLEGVTVATPNRREAFALARVPEQPPGEHPLKDESLLHVAGLLLAWWRPKLLMITLGAQGMLLISPDREPRHVPTVAREVFDVSGAGDTVIATTLLALAAGADEDQAATLANCAAGVVVGKLGTASCTTAELLACLEAMPR